jgi:hypothetical protein
MSPTSEPPRPLILAPEPRAAAARPGTAAAAWSFARLELGRQVRARTTAVAAAAFLCLFVLGHVQAWRGVNAVGVGSRYFPLAFLTAAALGLRFGVGTDRDTDFDEYILANFMTPAAYLLGKMTAFAGALLGLGAFSAVAWTALSGGDVAAALWYATAYTLLLWLLTPGILLGEMLARTRFPVVLVLPAAILILALLGPVVSMIDAGRTLGLDFEAHNFASLQRLALLGATFVPATLLVAGVVWSRVQRRRGLHPVRQG